MLILVNVVQECDATKLIVVMLLTTKENDSTSQIFQHLFGNWQNQPQKPATRNYKLPYLRPP